MRQSRVLLTFKRPRLEGTGRGVRVSSAEARDGGVRAPVAGSTPGRLQRGRWRSRRSKDSRGPRASGLGRTDVWQHELRLGLGRSQGAAARACRRPRGAQSARSGSHVLQSHAAQTGPEVSVPWEGAGWREEGPWPVQHAVVTRAIARVRAKPRSHRADGTRTVAGRLTGGLPIPRGRQAPSRHPEALGDSGKHLDVVRFKSEVLIPNVNEQTARMSLDHLPLH